MHIKIRTNKAPSQLSGAKDKENKKKKFFVTMKHRSLLNTVNKVPLKEINASFRYKKH